MNNLEPTAIVILGGGGDLALRKLFPALFDLFSQNRLPKTIRIIGLARTARTYEEYQVLCKEAVLSARANADTENLDAFLSHIRYVTGALDTESSYTQLNEAIHDFETVSGVLVNRLFYLAVPPAQYEQTFIYLHKSKLAVLDNHHTHFARILVEKPFGSDFDSAQKLDGVLKQLFPEEQIFRIDHYLAKEAIQNILSFRFANKIFQSSWNKEHIKEVRITMDQTLDVGTRGSFFDSVGALRDVGQNHLLQILALIAMDQPQSMDADDIRLQRALVLEKLVPLNSESVRNSVVRGQYTGYTETNGVAVNSQTETYFEFKAFLDIDTWRDVPFYVRSGKALSAEKVEVEILFHDVATGPFDTSATTTVGNSIRLTISPTQEMHLTINVKKQGHGFEVESNTLSYIWNDENITPIDAYEKVLLDCIKGDQTLFTKTEEVLASWKFITSIMKHWDSVPLQHYVQGSDGPEVTLHGIKN